LQDPPPRRSRRTAYDGFSDEPSEQPEFGTSVSDLLAEDIPRPKWLIRKYVLEKSIAILAGPPGGGKTLLAFDWAVQVANAGKRVFIVENEGSRWALQERLRRACAAAGLDSLPQALRFERNFGLSLAHKPSVIMFAEEMVGYDLIVLDSMQTLCPGLDENNPTEMGPVSDHLKLICEISGATDLTIHHATKASWKPKEWPTLADIRGHGSLAGRIDAAFIVKPISSTESSITSELHVVKQRDEDKPRPAKFEVLMKGPSAAVIFDRLDVGSRAPTPDVSTPERERLILALLADSPKSQTAICREIGGKRNDSWALIDAMIANNRLRRLPDGRIEAVPVGYTLAEKPNENSVPRNPVPNGPGTRVPEGYGYSEKPNDNNVPTDAGTDRVQAPVLGVPNPVGVGTRGAENDAEQREEIDGF